MKPLRFVVIGSGWRSLFYVRIAKAYPDCFQLSAMLCRSEGKAELIRDQHAIYTTTSVKECEELKPDFVVVAVNKASICQVTKEWAGKGFPVLCETPAAVELADLQELWRLVQDEGCKIQVAEQYFHYAYYESAIAVCRKGYLGNPYSVNLSAVHDYHAVSVIRRLLDIGYENVKIFGKKYTYPVVETDSRYGVIEDGRVSQRDRVRLTLEFEGGKTAFYDFDGIQYHSRIRSRHVTVQGERGELDGQVLRYVGENHRAREAVLEMIPFDSGEGIREVRLGDEILYQNPFSEKYGLPEDETAIGTLMLGMRCYIEEGVEVYPLAEGLQDAYISLLMKEAAESGTVVESKSQIWTNKII